MISNTQFRKVIWQYYKKNGRKLPWRISLGTAQVAYKILVSEFMLQQTQVSRVVPKYEAFLKSFPNPRVLAKASKSDVLKLWSGLGYNRRALYLHKSVQEIVEHHKGIVPRDLDVLETLSGIGPYTARAVATFAYDMKTVCIETNIRTVFIHFFFPNATEKVADKEILEKIEQTLPRKNFREWYWALMDYGSYLKSSGLNKNSLAKSHVKQSTFKGSNREVRGAIMKSLTKHHAFALSKILTLPFKTEKIIFNLNALEKEGFLAIDKKKQTISIIS